MANQSISQLPVASTITGAELAVVVQNGVTKQCQVEQIANAVSPGKLIQTVYFDSNSNLVFVYTDSTQQSVGPIPGYVAAHIAPNGHLILTNSIGGTTDAGSVFASLDQTFLTLSHESSLPNSQQLVGGSGITVTGGSPGGQATISMSGAPGSLATAGNGIIAKNSTNTVVSRTITSGSTGIAVTNGDGVSGNPTIGLGGKLATLEALNTNGFLASNGTSVFQRALTATANQITITNPEGFLGNPLFSIADNPVLPGTGSVTLPTGNTSQRPGNLAGQLRFNSQLDVFEGQNSSGVWEVLALGGGVTSITLGTGLTGAPNPITSTGTISISATGVTAGSYGSSSQVPSFIVNAQGQLTSAANVNISATAIGAVTSVSGTANEITSSGGQTPVISLPSALTFTGKSVTNGTFITPTISSILNSGTLTLPTGTDTLVARNTTDTLTNKSMSGSTNTFTNIPNSALVNSSLTIGTTNVALGATATTLAGLTSVTVTQDPVSDLQLATKQYVDNVAQGLNVKTAVMVATTGNITLSGEQTIDGVLTSSSRVLVKNQSAPAQNGIYVSASGAWTRSVDANTWNELISAFTFVQDGTTQADTGWVCTINAGGTLGTTPVTWTQFSGAGTYTAGTGLTLTGTQFSITNTAVTAGTYGTDARNLTLSVNAQGQITNIFDQPISIAASQINSAIPNSGLANSSITIGSTSISLGGSITTLAGTSISGATNTLSNIPNSALTNSSVTIGSSSVSLGGTVTTLSGVSMSGSSNTFTNIPNAALTNSSITINGSSVSLGGSVTVTATASNALTIGTGLSGSSYNGSTPVTVAIANTAVSAGSYGSASAVPTFTVNAQGQLTAASNTTIAITNTQVSGLGTMSTQNSNSVSITGGSLSGVGVSATSFSASQDSSFTSTGALLISSGTTAQQPVSPAVGMLRYNTTTGQFEGYSGVSPSWKSVGGAAISDDTTTNAIEYPLFVTATSGTAQTVYTSSTKYTYNPSTGALGFTSAKATNGFYSVGAFSPAPYTDGVVVDYVTGKGRISVGAGDGIYFYKDNSNSSVATTQIAAITSAGDFSASTVNATNGIVLNSATITTSFTVPTGSNAHSVGPVSVASGVTVTVSSGQRWVIS